MLLEICYLSLPDEGFKRQALIFFVVSREDYEYII